ncbi:MAG: hypothetical protein ACLP3C_31170 [Mycobacterium sp.]|uniref:hypothetical protein n=1 Tax=Mycobacterium sp. TaxID=1785 RepID=UPI003F9CBC74
MAAITGILVQLQTFNGANAGTDDEVYLGMWGKAGGREFPLRSSTYTKNFERGVETLYQLGVNVIGEAAVYPDHSGPGEQNDPAGIPIDLSSIEYVYLRKQAYGTGGDDDAWALLRANVVIYDTQTYPINPPNDYRSFFISAPNGLWLANEFGHQVWLTEDDGSDRRVPELLQRKSDKGFGD